MMHWSQLHTCLATGRISWRGWCSPFRCFIRSLRLMSSRSNTKQVCFKCWNSSWNLTMLVRSASSSLMTFNMLTWREKRRRDKTTLSTVCDQLHVLMEQTAHEHTSRSVFLVSFRTFTATIFLVLRFMDETVIPKQPSPRKFRTK